MEPEERKAMVCMTETEERREEIQQRRKTGGRVYGEEAYDRERK